MDKEMYIYKFTVILSMIVHNGVSLQYTVKNNGQWTSVSDAKIVSFENQTVYLPCAVQSVNILQPTQDQLTLILWYRSWNTSGPPIYSIDFRNSEDFRRLSNVPSQSAVHFISNEQFKNRILFVFDTCWLTNSYQNNFSLHNAFNMSVNHQINYHQFNHLLNNSKFSFQNTLKPTCALLKLEKIQLIDSGRYTCRMDFRRSRTLHTQLLLKVLEKPRHFELRTNERLLPNNSIISDLNEGSSLIVQCSASLKEKTDDVHLGWRCNDKLTGFYTNETHFQSGYLESKLRVRHLYRIFNEKSCSCYIISSFGQRLSHLQIHFQLHLAPISVSIIRTTNSRYINHQNANQAIDLDSSLRNSMQRLLQLDADQLTNLKCRASGSRPAANCKWSLLNGFQFKPKDYSESTSIESVSTGNFEQLTVATVSTLSTLHLLATNQMDNQIIRCTCSNPLITPSIQLTDQIHLEVLSKPILHLIYSNELQNKTRVDEELLEVDRFHQTRRHQVRIGESVRLICDVVKSNPSLNDDVRWFINDIELANYKKNYPNATVELEPAEQLSLIVRKVDLETTGRFFCMARNDKGETQSNHIILDVKSVPFCRPSQKMLYIVALGESIDVNCDLYADSMDPLLQFYWTLNKQPLPNTIYTVENDQPVEERFKWRPLNLNASNDLNGFNISRNYENNIVRSKLKFNSSNYQFEHATLACWAANSVGQQVEPCLFSLLAIGPPDVPNCTIRYFEFGREPEERQIEIGCEPGKSADHLVVSGHRRERCVPGNDNGLQQTLHLNVYQLLAGGLTIESNSSNKSNKSKALNKTVHNTANKANRMNNMINRMANSMTSGIHQDSDLLSDHLLTRRPTTIQHNNFIGQFNHLSTCDEHNHQNRESSAVNLITNQSIATNQTNQYIRFRRINLSTSRQYLLIMFASNAKGKSEQVEWMFDSGIHQLTSRETTLNYFQLLVLTGYFFVGILCATLFTYLLFTLALWFPFCLRLQLVIVNHRLLASTRKQTALSSNELFSIQPLTRSMNESTISRLTNNNIYNNLHQSNSLIASNCRANYLAHSRNKMTNLSKNFTRSSTINTTRLSRSLLYGANSINLTNSLPRLSSKIEPYDKPNLRNERIATNLANENIYINCSNLRNANDCKANKLNKF